MGFEQQIEKLKRNYTDKYVVVDGARPELARFRDFVGRVKTVNMSGRALVEFDDYHLNIGWFDIDLDFLKVVDKPAPKEKKPEAKKPAAKAEAKPAAAKAPAAKAKPAAGGGKSVADMLAAARGGGGAATPAPAKAPEAKKPAAAPKTAGGKMSVAEMLAAARSGGAGPPKAAPATPAVEAQPHVEEAAAETEVVKPVAKAAPKAAKSSGPVDRKNMTVAEMIACCRERDAR